MHNLVLYCKSFLGDLERLINLTESIEKHNIDKIPFYVSVPHAEYRIFQDKLPEWVNLIDDEQVYFPPVNPIRGWHQQQIVKAKFYLTGISRYYVSIDSDSYFFKDFTIDNFMVNLNTPYLVMHSGVSLHEWWDRYGKEHYNFDIRKTNEEEALSIRSTFPTLGTKGKIWDFSPSPFIWDCEVWKWLDKNYDIIELFSKHPNELKWYGEAALVSGAQFQQTDPLFACMHYPEQYEHYKNLGYTEENFHPQYLGMVMQSNWGAPIKY